MANLRIPEVLVVSTTRCASQFLLTQVGGHGMVPTSVSTLVGSVRRAVMFASFRQAILAGALVFLGIGLSLSLFATMAREQVSPPATGPETAAPAGPRSRPQVVIPPQATRPGPMVEIRGRVLDPAGQPVQGAWIVLDPKFHSISGEVFGTPSESAVSGPDGRFSFSIARAEIEDLRNAVHGADPPVYAAVAAGQGTAWAEVPSADSPAHDLVLQLKPDDIPITGRLLDHEGRPLAGVRASAFMIAEPPSRDFGDFLRRARSSDRQIQAKAWNELRSSVMLGFYNRTPRR